MTLQVSPQTKRVFHLSLPIFAELLLQLLVGNMDQFMISHFGSAAVAAIGNGNQVMNVVIIVLTTMSTAATILLTQHIGAGRVGKECSEIVTVAVTVSAARPDSPLLRFHRTFQPRLCWAFRLHSLKSQDYPRST